MRLRKELYDVLTDAVDKVDEPFANAIRAAAVVIDDICRFCEKSDLALQCAGEWLYQNDEAHVDALELVDQILTDLEDFAEWEEEE